MYTSEIVGLTLLLVILLASVTTAAYSTGRDSAVEEIKADCSNFSKFYIKDSEFTCVLVKE